VQGAILNSAVKKISYVWFGDAWRYADAGNLDPKRADAPLLTHEWITTM
jgi:hypothetical protein